ncbi:MAG: CBS domain-containing protein [Myxococcota bacterium]
MTSTLTVARVMTPFPYAVNATTSLAEARRMLAEHRFHHLPVMAGGKLTGVLRERDVALVELLGDTDRNVATVQVPAPYVVDMQTPLVEVLDCMATEGLDVTLVTRQGKLVGIITATDLARVLAAVLAAPDPPENETA